MRAKPPSGGRTTQHWDPQLGAVCPLGVYIDYTYYKVIAAGSWKRAVSKVTQHIAEADFIFRNTDMDLDGLPDRIGFRIKGDITVYRSAKSTAPMLGETTKDGIELLNTFSRQNFDRFCLAIAFTYREFGQLLNGRRRVNFD